mmetsp:Transcript_682/g.1611  ORF Transcript_682/g.1611 Transcript_682/m.1611 type:complete len:106 (-) Transcript_682:746-1063(-)
MSRAVVSAEGAASARGLYRKVQRMASSHNIDPRKSSLLAQTRDGFEICFMQGQLLLSSDESPAKVEEYFKEKRDEFSLIVDVWNSVLKNSGGRQRERSRKDTRTS